MKRGERRGLLFVALGVAFFSTSPVLVAWADPLDPFMKTFGRMAVGSAVVAAAAWVVRRLGGETGSGTEEVHPPRTAMVRFLAYGLIAALHFLFYIASLSYTTPAHALSIVYTAPIFVTLLSALFLHEPISRRRWLGIGVTVLGIAVLAGLEPTMNWTMALGDLFALFSAIAFGLYSIAGRYERARYPLLTYASRVYGAAALWLLPAALLTLPQTPASAWGWAQVGSIIGLGVGPSALGHTLYNASLRRVHATYVNIIASQEVTGGIILSWLLLGQVPSANSLAGAAITLVGILLVLL